MRVHHYLKNFLIFLPLIFSGKLFDMETLKISALGFLSFCFIASFIYVINDIADVNQDNSITILDLLRVQKHILGYIEIK